MKPVLISGMQPTGHLHLGNYLGALKNFVNLQNSGRYECFFFVADYHSLTEHFEPEERRNYILDLVATYLAAGLDPKKSTLFLQSTTHNTELGWIFNTMTPFGELRRMTQFKDKSESDPHNINVGLFDYPVLMAADILLYNPSYVPVGEDQLQHLELTRTLARKFNTKFGKTFNEPQPLLTEVPRLMSLDDAARKMSKSRPAGCLFIDDTPDMIREKMKRAVTDSGKEVRYDPKTKQAVSNLILIYATLSGQSIKKIEKNYEGKGYGEFKRDLGELIVKFFAPFQKKKKTLLKKQVLVKRVLTRGAQKANKIGLQKLSEIKKKMGLVI